MSATPTRPQVVMGSLAGSYWSLRGSGGVNIGTVVEVCHRDYPRDPSIQIIPTLGPKVCKYYLHWAIWIPRVRV